MYKYLFGPVPSRRLGVSLGVDLVTHKICSLDCVYCECGHTTNLTVERREYVPFNKVVEELDHYFANHPDPDYITFSGSGEPTLNSKIGDVIDYIKTRKKSSTAISEVKEGKGNRSTQEADQSKILVAVLTNGTLLSDESVRKGLLKADLVMPSLDAASTESFKRINRPHSRINLESCIQGLIDFRKVYKGKMALETLILPGFNDSKNDLELLKRACCKIKPDVVQLNTLDRPGTLDCLIPASRPLLEEIKSFIESEHIRVEIIASFNRTDSKAYRNDMESAVLETIYRRPCTVEDLASILGSHINAINKYLSTLEQAGKIVSVPKQRGIFYHIVK